MHQSNGITIYIDVNWWANVFQNLQPQQLLVIIQVTMLRCTVRPQCMLYNNQINRIMGKNGLQIDYFIDTLAQLTLRDHDYSFTYYVVLFLVKIRAGKEASTRRPIWRHNVQSHNQNLNNCTIVKCARLAVRVRKPIANIWKDRSIKDVKQAWRWLLLQCKPARIAATTYIANYAGKHWEFFVNKFSIYLLRSLRSLCIAIFILTSKLT